jgi:23S rRNA (guanosine2251-2'-O)-methyltransferase
MPEIIVIAHNIRSTHNVGSIFRTCEGFGIKEIIFSGYTPHPIIPHDTRLPHIAQKLASQITKTALGAELMVPFRYIETPPLDELRNNGYTIVALEQDSRAIMLHDYKTPDKLVLLLGEEVHGISKELIDQCDEIIEIPMVGEKESFNVSVATGIALYGLSYPNRVI